MRSKLQNAVTELQQAERDMRARLESLEAYQRSDNIVIRGLAEASYTEVGSPSTDGAVSDMNQGETTVAAEETFLRFCSDRLHVKLTSTDISVAHRLPKGNEDKVRPLVVRFTNRRSRDIVLRAKKALRSDPGDHVFVSEQLTKAASNIFYEARKLVRETNLFAA